jgi:cytochrome oxidase assembly protein ShyY1
MIRRLPVIPSMIVAAAVLVMIGLGIWQLGRAREKDALIATYRAAEGLPPISYPTRPLADNQLPLFRYATALCLRPVSKRTTAGRNRAGETGYSHIVDCSTGAEGPGISVDVGWARDPNVKVSWRGGPVSGVIAPDSRTRMRLVAATSAPGLAPSAPPSIDQIASNHRSYAVQWFAFAAIALLIYGLAVRKRVAAPPVEAQGQVREQAKERAQKEQRP